MKSKVFEHVKIIVETSDGYLITWFYMPPEYTVEKTVRLVRALGIRNPHLVFRLDWSDTSLRLPF